MYGKDTFQMVIADQMMDTILDMFDPWVRAMFTKDEAEKVKAPTCTHTFDFSDAV